MFPGRKVPAFVNLVVIHRRLWIKPLRPSKQRAQEYIRFAQLIVRHVETLRTLRNKRRGPALSREYRPESGWV